MSRIPKPWFREERKTYCVTISAPTRRKLTASFIS